MGRVEGEQPGQEITKPRETEVALAQRQSVARGLQGSGVTGQTLQALRHGGAMVSWSPRVSSPGSRRDERHAAAGGRSPRGSSRPISAGSGRGGSPLGPTPQVGALTETVAFREVRPGAESLPCRSTKRNLAPGGRTSPTGVLTDSKAPSPPESMVLDAGWRTSGARDPSRSSSSESCATSSLTR